MRLTLESTAEIVDVNGTKARVWTGETESGVSVIALITAVGVPHDAPADVHEAFERELIARSNVRFA